MTPGRRCRLEGRLEAGFALRPRAFRQAPPIFSVGVINLGGPESSPTCAQGSRCFPDILWCGLAPQTSPSHFLAELGGTSSLRARWWSVPVPNALHRSDGSPLRLGRFDSSTITSSIPIGTMCFPGRVEVACWAGRSVVSLTPGRRCLFWRVASRPVLHCVLVLFVRLLQSSPSGSSF